MTDEEMNAFYSSPLENFFDLKVNEYLIIKDNILTGESISQAISTITDAKLKDISFDITQSYTVSSVANSKQGEYLVTNGATQIIAYSDRTDFKIGDEVLIIDKGEVLLYGELDEVISNYEINGTRNHSLNEIFIDKVGKNYE